MSKKYSRIYICGFVASGKSTLAKNFARMYNLPVFVTDDFNFIDNDFRKKRTDEERAKLLANQAKKESWIIEGVHRQDWVNPGFKRAQVIVIVWPSWFRLIYQTIKRYNRNNIPATFPRLLQFLWWACKGQRRFIQSYKEKAKTYNIPVVVIRKPVSRIKEL